ncbi:MAG: zf-HC2 domain-containing protein [Pirellulales bacterium]|nr:zf-HC2 domain-containing protein [Planctomycetales bacterium]
MLRTLQYVFTFGCQESLQLLSQRRDEPLSRLETWALRLHLLGCRTCGRIDREFTLLESSMRQRTDRALQLSPAARRRIRHAIEQRLMD